MCDMFTVNAESTLYANNLEKLPQFKLHTRLLIYYVLIVSLLYRNVNFQEPLELLEFKKKVCLRRLSEMYIKSQPFLR